MDKDRKSSTIDTFAHINEKNISLSEAEIT